MLSGASEQFKYTVLGTSSVAIVDLSGEMNNRAIHQIENCTAEILGNSAIKFVLLNFTNVSGISGDSLQAVAQLQKLVRQKPADLRLCGLNDELTKKLVRLGLIRANELRGSLRQAIMSFSESKRPAA